MSKAIHTAVIGAGWAGCAAAVTLAEAGHEVTLIDAARTLGGRARQVMIHGQALDNGQHILLGAYQESLRLMRLVGIDQDAAMLRLPLQMRYPPGHGMDFLASRLPAPWHLIVALWRATGLARTDKMALVRFTSAARWMDWHLDTDCSVDELLLRFDQTERLIRLMWRPLCIAALNTPPQRASAQIFLNVLKDSLGGPRAASDMLLPRCDLSALFPQQAAQFVLQRGGHVLMGARAVAISARDAGWTVHVAGDPQSGTRFDRLVIATDSEAAATLLAPHADVAALRDFTHEPITTCYLQYPPDCRLALPFYALVDDPCLDHWGQFVFDRGHLNSDQAGLFAVVVSASGLAIASGHAELASALARQLAEVLQQPGLASPLRSKVITEKRATFSCTPGLQRPPNTTLLSGVVLAGDYTASPYPATLESAVRSGTAAARLLLDMP